MTIELAGRTVCIWGVGRHGGGLAAARFCARRGARVQLLDTQSPEQLAIAAVDCPWPWHVGDHTHPLLQTCDLVLCSPAIPPRALKALGRSVSVPEALALAEHRGPRFAVTGTKGKSTTTHCLATLLAASPCGNSHEPIAAVIDRLGPQTPLVCELSSFQLWHLRTDRPHFTGGICTGIGVDHLDWHPDVDHYRQAKQQLQSWCDWYLHEPETTAPSAAERGLLGQHMQRNLDLAWSAARRAGVAEELLRQRYQQVTPLPHRLCPVHREDDLVFIDDSAATNPQAAMAAVRAVAAPVVVIAGGSDKGADFGDLVAIWRQRVRAVVLIGATAPTLAAACERLGIAHERCTDMDAAVRTARKLIGEIRSGTILLSPACASFGLFADYAQRGEHFAAAARRTSTHG